MARAAWRCRGHSTLGTDSVWQFDLTKAGERSLPRRLAWTADGPRARRAGGITRNRAAKVLPPETPDSPLRNTTDVSTLLGESINQVRRGQLDPRVANAVGYLASILLNALDQGLVEERLSRVDATLGLGANTRKELATHADPNATSSN